MAKWRCESEKRGGLGCQYSASVARFLNFAPSLMPAPFAGDGGISIAAGIIIGLLASCVQSLGLTIQRKSHVLNQALPEDLQRVEHRRP